MALNGIKMDGQSCAFC